MILIEYRNLHTLRHDLAVIIKPIRYNYQAILRALNTLQLNTSASLYNVAKWSDNTIIIGWKFSPTQRFYLFLCSPYSIVWNYLKFVVSSINHIISMLYQYQRNTTEFPYHLFAIRNNTYILVGVVFFLLHLVLALMGENVPIIFLLSMRTFISSL